MASERMVREVAAVIAASWSDGRVPAVTDEERVEAELIGVALLADITDLEQQRDDARRLLAEAEARINRMQIALRDIEVYVRLGDDESLWSASWRALEWLIPGDLDPIARCTQNLLPADRDPIDPPAATDGGGS